MRRFGVIAALVTAAALVVVGFAVADPTARGIEHVTVSGNPTCSNLTGVSFNTQVKFSSPVVNGASAGGISVFVDGNVVGWFVVDTSINVRAVIVKGGNFANVYRYPGTDFSDGGLHTPTNSKNGNLYGLGYVIFCSE